MSTERGRMNVEPYEGMWDFDGACAPKLAERHRQKTFTLGCFQWVAMARGKRLKRGKVQYRVKGSAQSADSIAEAHARARAYCAKKQAQEGHA